MPNLLTGEEATEAKRHGWTVEHVFDLKQDRWLIAVLPIEIGQLPFQNAEAAALHVISNARAGSALCAKALQLVMAGNTPAPKGKKK